MEDDGENALENEISQIWELAKTFSRQMSYSIWNLACTYAGAVRGLKGSEHIRRQLSQVAHDTADNIAPGLALVSKYGSQHPSSYSELGSLLSIILSTYAVFPEHLSSAVSNGLLETALNHVCKLPHLVGTSSRTRGAKRQKLSSDDPDSNPAAGPSSISAVSSVHSASLTPHSYISSCTKPRPRLAAQAQLEGQQQVPQQRQMAALLRSLAVLVASQADAVRCAKLESADFANMLLQALPECSGELQGACVHLLAALARLHGTAPPAGLLLESASVDCLLQYASTPAELGPEPAGGPDVCLYRWAVLPSPGQGAATHRLATSANASGQQMQHGVPEQQPSKRARVAYKGGPTAQPAGRGVRCSHGSAAAAAAGTSSAAGTAPAAASSSDPSSSSSGGGLPQHSVQPVEVCRCCWHTMAADCSCSPCSIWHVSKPWLGPAETAPAAAAALRMLLLSQPAEPSKLHHKQLLQQSMSVVQPLLQHGSHRAREAALALVMAVHERSTAAGWRAAVQAVPGLPGDLAQVMLLLLHTLHSSIMSRWPSAVLSMPDGLTEENLAAAAAGAAAGPRGAAVPASMSSWSAAAAAAGAAMPAGAAGAAGPSAAAGGNAGQAAGPRPVARRQPRTRAATAAAAAAAKAAAPGAAAASAAGPSSAAATAAQAPAAASALPAAPAAPAAPPAAHPSTSSCIASRTRSSSKRKASTMQLMADAFSGHARPPRTPAAANTAAAAPLPAPQGVAAIKPSLSMSQSDMQHLLLQMEGAYQREQDVCRFLDLAVWVNQDLGQQWASGGTLPASLVDLAQGYCHRLVHYSLGRPPFVDQQGPVQAEDSAATSETHKPDLVTQLQRVMRAAQALCGAGQPGPRRWLAGCKGLVKQLVGVMSSVPGAGQEQGSVSVQGWEDVANEAAAMLAVMQAGDEVVRGVVMEAARQVVLPVREPVPGPHMAA